MSTFSSGLYVVATPLGNLGDLSPRAQAILTSASTIAAEDTRTTLRLLPRDVRPELVGLTEYNVNSRAAGLIAKARDGVVALVSEAGTPAIADPGVRLVAAAHDADLPVFAVPGPSALAAGLSVCGFETAPAAFLGFLPRQKGERVRALTSAAAFARVIVFYESPRRLSGSLEQLAETLRDPMVVVCRELTKIHEEVVRGRASILAARFADTRGECTVVVEVPPRVVDAGAELAEFLAEMREAGARRAAAASLAARKFGVPRSTAYDAWGDHGTPTGAHEPL